MRYPVYCVNNVLETSILISYKDLDNIDNSITLVFTDDRKSILRDTLTNELNLYNQIGSVEHKVMVNSDMDNFIRNNGFNNFKI
jgi:hypothetical protein